MRVVRKKKLTSEDISRLYDALIFRRDKSYDALSKNMSRFSAILLDPNNAKAVAEFKAQINSHAYVSPFSRYNVSAAKRMQSDDLRKVNTDHRMYDVNSIINFESKAIAQERMSHFLNSMDPKRNYANWNDLLRHQRYGAANFVDFLQNKRVMELMLDPTSVNSKGYKTVYENMQFTLKKYGKELSAEQRESIQKFLDRVAVYVKKNLDSIPEQKMPAKAVPKREMPEKSEVKKQKNSDDVQNKIPAQTEREKVADNIEKMYNNLVFRSAGSYRDCAANMRQLSAVLLNPKNAEIVAEFKSKIRTNAYVNPFSKYNAPVARMMQKDASNGIDPLERMYDVNGVVLFDNQKSADSGIGHFLKSVDPTVGYKDWNDMYQAKTRGAANFVDFVKNRTVQQLMKNPANLEQHSKEYMQVYEHMQFTMKRYSKELTVDEKQQVESFLLSTQAIIQNHKKVMSSEIKEVKPKAIVQNPTEPAKVQSNRHFEDENPEAMLTSFKKNNASGPYPIHSQTDATPHTHAKKTTNRPKT